MKPQAFGFAVKKSWFMVSKAFQRSMTTTPAYLSLSNITFHFFYYWCKCLLCSKILSKATHLWPSELINVFAYVLMLYSLKNVSKYWYLTHWSVIFSFCGIILFRNWCNISFFRFILKFTTNNCTITNLF